MKKKIWFITGASKGLGLALVKYLLQQQYYVAATSRNKVALMEAAGEENAFFLPLEVDLSNEKSIATAIKLTHDYFGKIDVVVNNAGYGIGGTIEELSEKEIQDSFKVNVFGTLNVVKAVMPYLRERRAGHIINISSVAGFAAATGWAVYAATKFAVTGFSEVLAMDVKDMGIQVTVVEPGAFRTQFLSGVSLVMPANPIGAYTAVRASHERYIAMDGTQAGDPQKAALALVSLAENPNPPLRLWLGSDAYQRAAQKIKLLQTALEENKSMSLSTDF